MYLDEGQAEFLYERLLTSCIQSIQTALTWVATQEKQGAFCE
jgi:hypothetical protein